MKKTKGRRICALLLSLLMICAALSITALAADQKAVRVGWFYQPGYQELDADGNPGGYNYEFLLALAEKAGWTLDFVTKDQNGDELTWGSSLSMLASGELDLMGCLLFSEERTSQYDFSTLAAGQTFTSLFVRDDSPLVGNDFSELNGISVAANTATLNDEDLTSFAEDSGFSIGRYQDCGDLQDVIDAVLEGSVDAGVMASYQPVENTRVVASFAPRSFYFATTKGNRAVLAALNEGMNSILIQDPYYEQNLSEKYSQTYSGQMALSRQEQDYIAAADPVRVGYSDAWFPLIQAGKDPEHPTGVIPDILAEISKSSGLRFEFVHTSTHAEAMENASGGACDMIAICIYDLQHEQKYQVSMTDPYLQMQLVMVSKTQTDSDDRIIGTMADFPIFDTAIDAEDSDHCKYYITAEECFEALRKGEADSIVTGAYIANYYLALSRYNSFLRTNLQGEYAPICMAVSEAYQDKALLVSILNKSISNLSATEVNSVLIENTVRDGSGLEAAVNRIPSTIIILAFLFLLMLTIVIAGLAVAFIRKSKLARQQAETQKAAAEQAAHQLRIDALTGLYNERGFADAARQKLDKFPDKNWYLLDFDVDGFKYINAMYGKEQSNQLLILIARILTEDLRPEEVGGRIYGDHFVALFAGGGLAEIRQRILTANERFKGITEHYLVLMSYGIYPIVDTTQPVSLLCDHAQVAKRKVKGNYNEFIAVYDDAMDRRQQETVELIMSFERALTAGEFQPFFQPQYDIRTKELVGAEALVRWRRGDHLVMPDQFISLFESNGLIENPDFYMVKAVCAHLKAQLDAGLVPVPVSVNFSKTHLYDQLFLTKLTKIIADSEVPPRLLVAEFTEYTCIENESAFRAVIHALHKLGVHVSLDDFGSGYSSLNVLSSMDFDEVKLDKGFLKESPLSLKGRRLIRSILQFMQGQEIRTVAEGVETKEQLAFLRECGCDVAQGYYFSHPVSGEEYDKLFHKG